MSTITYPLATLAATITPQGITAPSYNDILNSLIASYQSIYGSDVLLTADTQDLQLLAVFAQAIYDGNQVDITIYNGFSPTFAQGAALSSMVKINGIQREVATNSTNSVIVGGTVGQTITNGIVQDANGVLWDLPNSVEIPDAGVVTVTATAETVGAIQAAPGNLVIFNPQFGWQTAAFAGSTTLGAPVETDAALRQRQSISTNLPSQTPLEAILSAVANVTGVSRYAIYENDTNAPDANGVPSHSIAVVVQGGNTTAIAQTIQEKKSPGTGTYGTTSIIVEDQAGVPIQINFFELTDTQIFVALTVQPLNGWVATTGPAIVAAIVAFLNALAIGEEVYYNWVLSTAGLINQDLGQTFVITQLQIGLNTGNLGTANIPIEFTAAAACSTDNVNLTVLGG